MTREKELTEEEEVQKDRVLKRLELGLHYLATGSIYNTFSDEELREGITLSVVDGDLEKRTFVIKEI